jgi:hypothetical protein
MTRPTHKLGQRLVSCGRFQGGMQKVLHGDGSLQTTVEVALETQRLATGLGDGERNLLWPTGSPTQQSPQRRIIDEKEISVSMNIPWR